MGLFLSMACVIRGNEANVVDALRQYAIDHDMVFEKEMLSNYDESVCAIVASNEAGVTVMFPDKFFDWDNASCFLSERLGLPVFSFHIHDGDLWMYLLFGKGVVVDQFNPIPEYWCKLEEDELHLWKGDAQKVSELVPGLTPAMISNYLVRWTDEILETSESKKAYPTDQHQYGVDWQLVDFMDKLGLIFPDDDSGNDIGEVIRFADKRKRRYN